jgi:hypothetical protein
MKHFAAIIGLFLWFVFSLLLVCTIIGVIVATENEWLAIPKQLLRVFDND